MKANLFKRSVLTTALATLMYASGPVLGESFAGTVKGSITSNSKESIANATITVTHKGKGISRTIHASEDGQYVLRKLPVGEYLMTIQKEGFTTISETLTVQVGSSVVLESQLVAESNSGTRLQIIGSRISRVDTASSTGGMTITSDELAVLPVADGFSNIANLAPGVSKSTSFNSNSFGGSSSAENGYYLNGLNVTNIRKGMGEIDLPFEAISQTEVKTGGIDPEFGGALGGIVNAVSKSGSNEFEFVAQGKFTPESLRQRHDNLVRLDGTTLSNSENGSSDYSEYRFSASGPIINDKVFGYVLVQPETTEFKSRNIYSASNGETKTNSWFAKADWNINDDHLLEFTGIGFETKSVGQTYAYDFDTNGDVLGDYNTDFISKTGGEVFGAKYTGYISDSITLDVIAGRTVEQDYNTALDDLPGVWDERGANSVTLSNHSSSSIEDGKYTRDQFRADLAWDIDDHSLKFGIDHYSIDVDYAFVQNGVDDARGWWTIATSTGPNDESNQTAGEDYIERRVRGRFVNSKVTSSALYFQDSWEAAEQLVLNFGMRYSNQSNTVSDGRKYVDLKNQLAPRLSAIYDLNGDGSSKTFATFGRYFQPVSANMNITQGSAQRETFDYYELGDVDANGVPILLADGSPARGNAIGGQRVRQQGITEPGLIASSNLKGMYSDEFTLGYQQEVFNGDMSFGVRYIYRELGASLEDTDMGPVLASTLAELGIEDNVGQGGYYVLYNPGEDVVLSYDFDGDGVVDNITLSAEDLQIPKPERTYKALEFTLNGKVTDALRLNVSYLWSHSEGMTEGLVKSDTDRAAPGWTTSYDYADIMDHGYGDLPNDRRHYIKAAGTYTLTEDLTLGFFSRIASGTPVNKFGIHPFGVDSCAEGSPWEDCISHYYGPYSFYDWQGNPAPRGTAGRTPWTAEFDLSLTYQTSVAENDLTFSAKIFNVFNAETATKVDQVNAIWQADEIVANPQWNRTTGRQGSRYISLLARYEF